MYRLGERHRGAWRDFCPDYDFLSFTGVGVVDFFERGRGMIVLDIYCE